MSSKKAVLAMAFVLLLASMACTNPIASYFSTRTAVMETATATMWTPTPTNTATSTPTPTKTPTRTSTPTPDNRFYETGGEINFSYVPPTDWKKSIDTNGLYEWQGTGNTGLTFLIQASSTDASTEGGVMETTMESTFPGYQLVDDGAFSPASGLDSFRFAFTAPFQASNFYFEWFIFSGNGYLVEALYIRTDSANEDQDALVTDSMMTVQFD